MTEREKVEKVARQYLGGLLTEFELVSEVLEIMLTEVQARKAAAIERLGAS